EEIEIAAAESLLQRLLKRVLESIEGFDLAGVELEHRGLAAFLCDFGRERIRLYLVRMVGADHVDAVFGEANRCIAANPAARASNEGDFRSHRVLPLISQ